VRASLGFATLLLAGSGCAPGGINGPLGAVHEAPSDCTAGGCHRADAGGTIYADDLARAGASGLAVALLSADGGRTELGLSDVRGGFLADGIAPGEYLPVLGSGAPSCRWHRFPDEGSCNRCHGATCGACHTGWPAPEAPDLEAGLLVGRDLGDPPEVVDVRALPSGGGAALVWTRPLLGESLDATKFGLIVDGEESDVEAVLAPDGSGRVLELRLPAPPAPGATLVAEWAASGAVGLDRTPIRGAGPRIARVPPEEGAWTPRPWPMGPQGDPAFAGVGAVDPAGPGRIRVRWSAPPPEVAVQGWEIRVADLGAPLLPVAPTLALASWPPDGALVEGLVEDGAYEVSVALAGEETEPVRRRAGRAGAAAVSAWRVEQALDGGCSDSMCHGWHQSRAGLDFRAPGSLDALVGQPSVESGLLVAPGDPEGSVLLDRLLSLDPTRCAAPLRGAPLDPAEVRAIRRWIEENGET